VNRNGWTEAWNLARAAGTARALGTAAAVLVLVLVLGAGLAGVADAGGSGGSVHLFKLKNLEGDDVELEKVLERGPVLIDFWATWCQPCIEELPHVDEIGEKYEDQGLTVLAISIDATKSLSKVKSFIKTHQYGFEVLLDPNRRTLRKLKSSTVPYVLLVAPDGEIVYIHSKYRKGDEKELEQVVAQAMADFAGSGDGTASDGEAESDDAAHDSES
jgi:peroxiredoxin